MKTHVGQQGSRIHVSARGSHSRRNRLLDFILYDDDMSPFLLNFLKIFLGFVSVLLPIPAQGCQADTTPLRGAPRQLELLRILRISLSSRGEKAAPVCHSALVYLYATICAWRFSLLVAESFATGNDNSDFRLKFATQEKYLY
jgi:hypothetical protein